MSAAIVAEWPHAEVNFSALGFFRKYEGVYKDLWAVLGRTWVNLASETVWSRDTIPGPQHGELKVELTDAQRTALMPLLSKMGFFRACNLRGGTYDEMHVTGAKFPAMCRRAKMLVDRLAVTDPKQQIRFGRITSLNGQRPRQDVDKGGNLFDGSVEEIYAQLSPAVKANKWVRLQMELMNEPNPTAMWHGAFATEFELAVLAFIIATDGAARVVGGESNSEPSNLPGIPKRALANLTVELPDGTLVLVLNGPAVMRPHAPNEPRPTTLSTTQYWLDRYTPKRGGKIATMSGKTHWYRVICDFERLLHKQFPDISVSGFSESAGDSAEALAVLNNALGEAVWLLQKAYEELLECLQV